MARTDNARSYTEARHEAWADVEGAAPVVVQDRRFLPGRICVTYDWRTQLGDTRWSLRSVVLSGPWVDADGTPTGAGSGNVLLLMSDAPDWARQFAADNVPRTALVEQ